MGFLNTIFKPSTRTPSPLPSGSFTVNPEGEIISSTVSSSFTRDSLKQVATVVLHAFRDARQADVRIGEFTATLGSMKIKARELRGGAIIFLTPRNHGKSEKML